MDSSGSERVDIDLTDRSEREIWFTDDEHDPEADIRQSTQEAEIEESLMEEEGREAFVVDQNEEADIVTEAMAGLAVESDDEERMDPGFLTRMTVTTAQMRTLMATWDGNAKRILHWEQES